MSDLRGIIKSTSVYTILGFLPLAFGFFITPLYTYYLSKEQMGEINLFNTLTTTLLIFYSLGVDASFSNLYFENFQNKKKIKLLQGTSLSLILVFSAVVALVLMLAGKYLFSFFLKNPGIYFQSPIIFFFILMPFFSLVYNFFIAYYRNEQKLLQYSILNLSTFAGMTIGTLAGVIFLKLDVLGAIAGRTIGYGFFVILFLIIHIFSEGIRWNARFAKRILLFGLPIFVYLAIGQISLIVDRLMIERFFDLGELGIYGLAMIMASVVEIWIGAISNAISPLIYRYIKTNIEENAEKIRFLFKIQYLCVLVMICFIIAVAKPMADLLFSDKFREAVYYVPVLAVSFAARALYIVRMPIVFSYNKTKYLSLIHVVSLIVSVGFSFLFMPYLGVLGIAIAVLMTKFSQVIMAVFFSNKVYNFSYKFSRYYIITLLLLVNVTVIYLFYQKINPYLLLSSPLALFISYFAFQKRELKEIVAFIKARS